MTEEDGHLVQLFLHPWLEFLQAGNSTVCYFNALLGAAIKRPVIRHAHGILSFSTGACKHDLLYCTMPMVFITA